MLPSAVEMASSVQDQPLEALFDGLVEISLAEVSKANCRGGFWHRHDGGSFEACLKDELLCNLHRKMALRLLKRCEGPRHDDDVGVFSRLCPPRQSKPTDSL